MPATFRDPIDLLNAQSKPRGDSDKLHAGLAWVLKRLPDDRYLAFFVFAFLSRERISKLGKVSDLTDTNSAAD